MSPTIDLAAIAEELGPRFAERAAMHDDEGAFVHENYALLKERRVFSAQVPQEFGGGGATHSQMCSFIRTLASRCGSTALALSMHQHVVATQLFNHRNGKPGRALLEKVGAGEAVIVSTGGNDWLESNGTMERVEGGFRVSARKPFASGSPAGDILVTSAPYLDPGEGWQVLHFPVSFRAEGLSLAGDWNTMGMRATGSETVILDGVFVPKDSIALRRPRDGFHPAFNVILAGALPMIVSAYLGVAEAAAGIATEKARSRADDPATAFLLGEMTNHLTTAQLAWESMVAIANDLDFAPMDETGNKMVIRKTIVAKALIAVVEKALEVAGGSGYYRKPGLERLLRDIHAIQFHPLTEKKQLAFTGRLALGLAPVEGSAVTPMRAAAE